MRRPRTRSASPPTLEETTSTSGRRLPVAVTGLVVGLVGERVHRPVGDLLDRSDRVDTHSDVAVVLDQRLGLGAVDLLPVPDGLLGVVRATAGGEALDELLVVDLEHDHGVEALAELIQ